MGCHSTTRGRTSRRSRMPPALRAQHELMATILFRFDDTCVELTCPLQSCRPSFDEALADPGVEPVGDLAIGCKLLVAVAGGVGRVGRRPIFDIGGQGAG